MKNIMVLGSGCAKCVKTVALIKKIASKQNCPITITKEINPESLITYDVMNTPAVVIDNCLVHSGSVPSESQIYQWLKNT